MDYLVEEVLVRQPPEIKDFLLRTAIVDHICAPLADALVDQPPAAGGSQATLDRLVRANLYLEPSGDEESWFRYHPLFRDLLRHQLELRFSRTERADLHAEAEALLPRAEGDVEALRGEIEVLPLGTVVPIERDPHGALAVLRRAVQRLPADHRFPYGLAHAGLGLALQANGQTAEAVQWLTRFAEREAERVDAGSIRALQLLMFVHRQDGNLRECERVARHVLALAERHGLPVATGWAHLFLGFVAYEHDELAAAIEHDLAIVADYRRVHLSCTFEALLGLALAYQAKGMVFEADNTLRRLTEIILDANALEYLPTLQGFEARLALLRHQPERAMSWLSTPGVTVDIMSLHSPHHALAIRVQVLLAEGSAASLDEAWRAVEALRVRAESSHHRSRLVEILALAALVRDARGQPEAALTELARSVALAAPAGFCRTYVDLGPAIVPLLRRLAADPATSPYPARLLQKLGDRGDRRRSADTAPAPSGYPGSAPTVLELLTARESEVLECLWRRLSYCEIASELFISPMTVKRLASSTYGKLDVGNRRQALAKAQALGWTPAAG